ncbi:MAG: hypothetical protein Q8O19_03270 [Rectinemataceae bacterium]|nr:hypothetical protein [Rectinemataceae bacterium]
MKAYRMCGKFKGARKNSQYDHPAKDDEEALSWATDHCTRHPMFMPARLVEVIAVGEYRTLPFGLA